MVRLFVLFFGLSDLLAISSVYWEISLRREIVNFAGSTVSGRTSVPVCLT